MKVNHIGRGWLLGVGLLLLAGCGAKAGNPPVAASASSPTASSRTAAASPDTGGSAQCQLYAGAGLDVMGQPGAYLFIGDHPMCADAARKREFCNAVTQRAVYVATEAMDREADTVAGAEDMPEEERAFALRQHPPHALEKALVACGLKPDEVRTRLSNDAVAAIAAGRPEGNDEAIDFLVLHAPDAAETIWKRECAGHLTTAIRGEELDLEFHGKPAFRGFCGRTSTADKPSDPPHFRRPAGP